MKNKGSQMHRSTPSIIVAFAFIVVIPTISGCATVLSEKRYPVTVENTSGSTYFSVHDRKQRVIHQGVTPQQVTLDAKAFPFWPAKYDVVFAGSQNTTEVQTVKAGVDPWTAGNILLGGFAGLAVDGATGAMFKLPKNINGNVPQQYAVADPNHGSSLVQAALGTGPTAAPGTTIPTTIAAAPSPQQGPQSSQPAVRVASAAE